MSALTGIHLRTRYGPTTVRQEAWIQTKLPLSTPWRRATEHGPANGAAQPPLLPLGGEIAGNSFAQNSGEAAGVPGFALPDHDNPPTRRLKLGYHSDVARRVCLKFLCPVFSTRARVRRFAAPRMSMPKAAVDKERDTSFWEHEIWRAWQLAAVKSEPKAERVSRFSDADFRSCVLSPHSGHQPRPPLARQSINQRESLRCYSKLRYGVHTLCD